MRIVDDGAGGDVDDLVIGLRLGRRGALVGEFRDVGAGREGLVPGPADDDAAHARIGAEFEHRLAQPAPGREVQRIQLVGTVEDDRDDGAVAPHQDRIGRRIRAVVHAAPSPARGHPARKDWA
jgi:hypothetical protein